MPPEEPLPIGDVWDSDDLTTFLHDQAWFYRSQRAFHDAMQKHHEAMQKHHRDVEFVCKCQIANLEMSIKDIEKAISGKGKGQGKDTGKDKGKDNGDVKGEGKGDVKGEGKGDVKGEGKGDEGEVKRARSRSPVALTTRHWRRPQLVPPRLCRQQHGITGSQ